eukprot:gene20355-7368_t
MDAEYVSEIPKKHALRIGKTPIQRPGEKLNLLHLLLVSVVRRGLLSILLGYSLAAPKRKASGRWTRPNESSPGSKKTSFDLNGKYSELLSTSLASKPSNSCGNKMYEENYAEEENVDKAYFNSYGDVAVHALMIND